MTVSSQTWRFQIPGVGLFFPNILVMALSDVKVVDVDNTTGQETAVPVGEYTLVLSGGGATLPNTFVIQVTSAIPSGKTRWVYREGADIQDVDYVLEGAFDSNAHERAIDRRTLVSIEHLNRMGILGFRAPISEARVKPLILPPASVRASKVLAFDAGGEANVITAVPAGSVAFTPNGQQLVEAADFAAMRALLDLEPGVDYQPADADLTAIAALAHTVNHVIQSNGATWITAAIPGQQMPRGHLWGCEISMSGDNLTVSAGERRDQGNTQNMTLAAPMTKGAGGGWVIGSGSPGNGDTVLTNQWYHVFLIRRNADGVIDVGLDRSLTAANLLALSAFDQYRRLGSVFRTAVPDLKPFIQDGDSFLWVDPPMDVDDTNPGTGGVTKALSIPPDVRSLVQIQYWTYLTIGTHRGKIMSMEHTDAAMTDPQTNPMVAPFGHLYHDWGQNFGMGQIWVRSNTLRQIRYRLNASDAGTRVRMAPLQWLDTRGRLN